MQEYILRVCEADLQVVVAIIINDLHPLGQDRPDLVLRIKVCCAASPPWTVRTDWFHLTIFPSPSRVAFLVRSSRLDACSRRPANW